MKIHLAADHNGFELKEKIKTWLTDWGYDFEDHGNAQHDPADDFPDFAGPAAEAVSKNPHKEKGIVICGSAAGTDIVANKYKGVWSSVLFSPEQAKAATKDDGLNIIALSAWFVEEDINKEIIKTWLETHFEENVARRDRRMGKVREIEERNMKTQEH